MVTYRYPFGMKYRQRKCRLESHFEKQLAASFGKIGQFIPLVCTTFFLLPNAHFEIYFWPVCCAISKRVISTGQQYENHDIASKMESYYQS